MVLVVCCPGLSFIIDVKSGGYSEGESESESDDNYSVFRYC